VLLGGVKRVVNLPFGEDQAQHNGKDTQQSRVAVGDSVPKPARVFPIAAARGPKKPPEVIAFRSSSLGWILLPCRNGIACDLRRLLGRRANVLIRWRKRRKLIEQAKRVA